MTAFNRVGLTWGGHSSDIQDGILRGEWGFQGFVITDAAGVNSYMHSGEALMNGTDMFCYTSGAAGDARIKEINAAIRDTDDGNIVEHLKEINHRIYYTYAHTHLMNGLASAYDIVSVTPWWQPVILGANIVLIVVMLGLYVLYLRSDKKKTKEVG
mgnify:CR=1 FL=1